MPVSDYVKTGREKKYSEYTWMEKLLPPLLNYLVRKLFLGLSLVLVLVLRLVCNRFRFEFSASVGDREEWIWFDDVELPVLRLDRKNVNTKPE